MRLNLSRIAGLLAMISSLVGISCDRIHEELETCPTGVRLRFVYDYNMEFANAFPSQVDCLTLLIYDSGGRYLTTRTATKSETENEDWRMDLDLPPGVYEMLAYGGMECSEASFAFTAPPAETSYENLQVRLDDRYFATDNDLPLHHLFYGSKEITVPQPGNGTGLIDETIYMIKDTNDIRIILANADGTPVVGNDFDYSLTADNTLLNYLNNVVPTRESLYRPWAKGNVVAGVFPDGEEATVAFAEISTSRLIDKSDTRLIIKHKDIEEPIINISLPNILLLLKSERFNYMGEQEFLDRNSRWNLTFLLAGDGTWLKTKIVINDWVVRINNISEL